MSLNYLHDSLLYQANIINITNMSHYPAHQFQHMEHSVEARMFLMYGDTPTLLHRTKLMGLPCLSSQHISYSHMDKRNDLDWC